MNTIWQHRSFESTDRDSAAREADTRETVPPVPPMGTVMASQPGDGDTDNEADDEALELLSDVRLHSFTANPVTIAPFGSSRLSWSVMAPDGVTIRLNDSTVPASGGHSVQPAATETYRLSAKAGRYSKILGVVTVHVNFAQCLTLESTLLPQLLAAAIKERIDADDSGLYFRLVPVPGPNGTTYVRSKPSVTISADRLNIALQLGQDVDDFPDASLDLSVSFGLQVVQDSFSTVGYRRIVAAGEEIKADVSFPFYAWLIPGAMIFLPVAIDNGKQKARARAHGMISEIVGLTGPVPDHSRNLNNFFATPHGTEKHHVRLFVGPDGRGTFAVTFCPDLGPVVVS